MRKQPPENSADVRRAKLALFIAGISMLVSFGSVYYSFQQVLVMREQLSITDRPWIKVIGAKDVRFTFMGRSYKPEKVEANGAWSRDELFNNVIVEVKNVGHSVATQIHVRSLLILPLWKNGFGDVIRAEQKNFCKSLSDTEDAGDTILFPDEEYDAGSGNGVSLSSSTINLLHDSNSVISAVVPVLIGCVDYQYPASTKHHQTGFIYEIFQSNGRTRFFKLGEDKSANDILMIKNPQYDYAY